MLFGVIFLDFGVKSLVVDPSNGPLSRTGMAVVFGALTVIAMMANAIPVHNT